MEEADETTGIRWQENVDSGLETILEGEDEWHQGAAMIPVDEDPGKAGVHHWKSELEMKRNLETKTLEKQECGAIT